VPKFSNILNAANSRGLAVTARAAARALGAEFGRWRGHRFVERQVYDYRMLLDLNDQGISRTLLLFGQRELEHKIMLERILRPGMSVLDIGANIGYYPLMELQLIKPGGKLIAVEPSPANVALLKRNLALNGHADIEVHQLAVSNCATKRRLFMSEMSNLNTFHATGTGTAHLKGEAIEVATTTVPAIMAGRPLDLIRMDVEGHEVEVLAGLLPAIERGQMAPQIIFETHLSRYTPHHDVVPILRRLFAHGYRVTLAGSSSERGTKLIESRGYRGLLAVRTDDVKRMLFENLRDEDALDFISGSGGLRTVLLATQDSDRAT
jgi:FkbM family methyltransferase